MGRFLKLHYLPLVALFGAILYSHAGGNDKAPFLVFAAAGGSVVLGALYFITLRPIKGLIAIVPGLGCAALFAMGYFGLIDLMPIFGFR